LEDRKEHFHLLFYKIQKRVKSKIFTRFDLSRSIALVNADGIKIIGQLGADDIGQYILSLRR